MTFSARLLPLPPRDMVTDRLIIAKTTHNYDSHWQTEALHVQAHKETYRQLGLLILAVVFHETPAQVHLTLTHPVSDIKHLIVEFEYLHEARGGYITRPYAFTYTPEMTERHPWYYRPWDSRPLDLPTFFLTNREGLITKPEEWGQRDTVHGFGSDNASVLFAELLLNASNPNNVVNEYQLEGEGGFRGVGPQSAEVALFFPGSLGWTDDL